MISTAGNPRRRAWRGTGREEGWVARLEEGEAAAAAVAAVAAPLKTLAVMTPNPSR